MSCGKKAQKKRLAFDREISARNYREEAPGPAPGRRRSCPGRQPPPPVTGGEELSAMIVHSKRENREVEYYTQGHLEKALKKLYRGSHGNNLKNTQQKGIT